MKNIISNRFVKQVVDFSNFYNAYKTRSAKLASVRYRIITTLDEFKKSNLIQLSFSDNPGDLLAPLPIEKIKKTPDILEGMHPIDINTINDLHYLSRDKIIQIKIDGDNITALTNGGKSIEYNILDNINPDTIESPRVSYMIGYMQAEKLMRESYSIKDKFQIVKDNISSLEILDKEKNQNFLKNPLDILFSQDYLLFSKEDIGRIGYICGQMSNL